ncbi:MAG: threonine synthase [Planctomycetota bacterium]
MTGLIERWRDWLPVSDATPVVSLQEGSTPLIQAPGLEKEIGGNRRVFLKYDGANPTASFKDRGMTLAMSKAMEEGCRGVICASTGNTSASAAAYAARAGVPCYVVLPAGNVATGKLAQAIAHGAVVVPIDGNFDDALRMVREAVAAKGLTLVNSVNPYRIEGQKTVALEIIEELGAPPDAHFLPVGNAGNITAAWRGYCEWAQKCDQDNGSRRPQMFGFQAAGAAPIVHGHAVEKPETIATAIRIGNPASWTGATNALAESNGAIAAVTDDEILAAYRHLAAREGVFCEPASAASAAGLLQQARNGTLAVKEGATIVCTLTGHGLKDPDTAVAGVAIPDPIPVDLDTLLARMEAE